MLVIFLIKLFTSFPPLQGILLLLHHLFLHPFAVALLFFILYVECFLVL